MKKTLIFLFFSSLLSGCASQQQYISTEDIQYIKDTRSHLCFAVVHSASAKQHIGMTTVDCDSIEGLLSSQAITPNDNETIADRKNYYSIRSFSSF